MYNSSIKCYHCMHCVVRHLCVFVPYVCFTVWLVSEKAVKQMRVEQKQMLQKITDNDEQWEKAREELTQVVSQHSVTQAKLEEQEQLTFMEEQRARVRDNICLFSVCTSHNMVWKKVSLVSPSDVQCCFHALQTETETLKKELTGQRTAMEVIKVHLWCPDWV